MTHMDTTTRPAGPLLSGQPSTAFPCRTCGKPGRPYLSGRWCLEHCPHPAQPVPPPHALRRTHGGG